MRWRTSALPRITPGKQNVAAEAISTRPAFVCLITRRQSAGSAAQPEFSRGDCAKFYECCDDSKDALAKCRECLAGTGERESEPRVILQDHREYQADADFLWVRTEAGWRVCVPSGYLREDVLEQFHGHILAGRPGVYRAHIAARSLFWRPKMDRAVECFVKSCPTRARGTDSHLQSGAYCNHCFTVGRE